MENIIKKAGVLIEAIPYIYAFRRKVFVIKYGGRAMESDKGRRSILQDIVFLSSVGIHPILVHGGGPQIDARVRALGNKVTFVDGKRVTDEKVAGIVDEVLSEINRDLVREIREELKGHAEGLDGKGGLFEVKKETKKELGYVGEIVKVHGGLVAKAFEDETIPVVSPISKGKDRKLYNVNADEAATKLAEALKAEKLVFFTDVNGILQDRGDSQSRIPTVKVGEVESLISKKVIEAGMIPKVRAAVHAISKGVKKVHIINGNIPRALLLEIFTEKGIGTEIVK